MSRHASGFTCTASPAALVFLVPVLAVADDFGSRSELRRIGHLLNRAAYGPTYDEVKRVSEMGIEAWIEEQLRPASIDESSNAALQRRVVALQEKVVRRDDRRLVARGDLWRYYKGKKAPPDGWNRRPTLDDSDWQEGPSGFGYGDDDDATVLEDMRGSYGSVFLRHKFSLSRRQLSALNDLILRVKYDDGFVAFLNGREIARRNVAGEPGVPVSYSAFAREPSEAEGFEEIDVSGRKDLLRAGQNLLAIQAHNRSLDSSDLTMVPELLDRKVRPETARLEIRGADELKALAHVYALYSRRQLQTVVADFWENHLTTDLDKVAEYMDDLKDSDASDAMSEEEARREAARLEHYEYEFLREHALGNFGDLLRFSATSPTMLIYLDNVLNVSGNANENYAREILELHSFGADNGYDQVDIEQLSKCFTGWGVAKVAPEHRGNPHAPHGVQTKDTVLVAPGAATANSGEDWRYFKGRGEPSRSWTGRDFDDSRWREGPCGIGYGDRDDATVLSDMRNSYTTVYLRKTFTVADPAAVDNLILTVDVDDGFVAYLNGREAARFNVPGKAGERVGFDATAPETHEAGADLLQFNLNALRGSLTAGDNVLAIQVVNGSKRSSDLSMVPTLIDREVLPGSIEYSDPWGVWSFRFFPELHNTAEKKTLFADSEHELEIDAGRSGARGIRDGQEAIDRILEHPSTPVFVCSKLIQRFVSDEIGFRHPSRGPNAKLLGRCIAAWNSTTPTGDIARVMRTILTSEEFWSERCRRAKVKDPFEYVASTSRVIGAQTSGRSLVGHLESMGMEIFTRDDPDGWPELGSAWVNTSSFQNRMVFAQTLSDGTLLSNADLYWDARRFLRDRELGTADEIVDFFGDLLFQGELAAADRALVKDFLTTDGAYNPIPLDPKRVDFEPRVRRAVGLMLSLPLWQFQ